MVADLVVCEGEPDPGRGYGRREICGVGCGGAEADREYRRVRWGVFR